MSFDTPACASKTAVQSPSSENQHPIVSSNPSIVLAGKFPCGAASFGFCFCIRDAHSIIIEPLCESSSHPGRSATAATTNTTNHHIQAIHKIFQCLDCVASAVVARNKLTVSSSSPTRLQLSFCNPLARPASATACARRVALSARVRIELFSLRPP